MAMKHIKHPDIPGMYREATREMQNMGRRLGRAMNTPGPSGVSFVGAVKIIGKAAAHVPKAMLSSPGLKKRK